MYPDTVSININRFVTVISRKTNGQSRMEQVSQSALHYSVICHVFTQRQCVSLYEAIFSGGTASRIEAILKRYSIS